MTQKLLKLSQEALAKLKDVERQVRELVAENKALKEALAQPEQEPVAIVDANDDGYWADILPNISVKVGQMLYTTPPQRKPLTDEDVERIVREARVGEHGIGYTIARAIEAAHGIKE